MCSVYAGGWALFAGGVGGAGDAGGDALCASLYAGGAGGNALCALCMLEAVEGGLCLPEALEVLEMLEVMRNVLLCMLEVPEVMRCVQLCMLEVTQVMRCVLSVCWKLWRVGY